MSKIKSDFLAVFNHDESLQSRIETELVQLKKRYSYSKEYESFVFDEISPEIKALALRNFPIKEWEKMLFIRINKDEAYSYSLWSGTQLKQMDLKDCYLLTDRSFYYKEENVVINEHWEDIDKFVYENYSQYIEIGGSRIRININKHFKLFNEICQYHKTTAFVPKMLIDSGDYQLALDEINSMLKSNVGLPILRFFKGLALMGYIEGGKKRKLWGLYHVSLKPNEIEFLINEAEQEFDYLLYSNQKELEEEIPMINFQKSKIAKYRKNTIIQRRFLIKAMATGDYTLQNQIHKEMIDAENNIKDVYTDVTYDERKIVTFVKELNKNCSTNVVDVFRIDNRPSQIRFPNGHPRIGELYIGHPYRKDLYIPYANHEFTFFLDEINEYCELLQALGATEVTIEVIKGKNISEMQNYSFNATGGASYGYAFKAHGEYNEKKESTKKSSLDNYLKEYQKMEPMTPPYVPETMIWYPERPRWQRLSNQRTNNNNLLEFAEEFSSKESSFVSDSELESIKADLQILKVGANISVNEKFLKQVERSEETVWRINVKFKSISDFAISKSGYSQNYMLNQKEDEYRSEVLFCIKENGCITDLDRRILDKKRLHLDLSVKRAVEIEELCLPHYTDNEKKYLDILEALDEADINSPSVQKRIMRERGLLNISDTRAKELEHIFVKQKS